jgi:hypothetical protein
MADIHHLSLSLSLSLSRKKKRETLADTLEDVLVGVDSIDWDARGCIRRRGTVEVERM